MIICKKVDRPLHQKNRSFVVRKGVGLSLDIDPQEKVKCLL